MSRRTDIDDIVEKYGELKDKESELKKEIKPLNEEIKKVMIQNNLDSYKGKNYTAKIIERQNEDFNEDKAIEILKKKLSKEDLKSVILTKEYIDDDALENLIYEGKFAAQELESCKIVKKPTITLRINKGGKNNE